jgi:hypothetical protein
MPGESSCWRQEQCGGVSPRLQHLRPCIPLALHVSAPVPNPAYSGRRTPENPLLKELCASHMSADHNVSCPLQESQSPRYPSGMSVIPRMLSGLTTNRVCHTPIPYSRFCGSETFGSVGH